MAPNALLPALEMAEAFGKNIATPLRQLQGHFQPTIVPLLDVQACVNRWAKQQQAIPFLPVFLMPSVVSFRVQKYPPGWLISFRLWFSAAVRWRGR